MKKIKELSMAFIAIIACISMTACSSDIDAPVADEEQDVYTVQLGWGGELDVTYEPLSRATTDDVYGIQVYSTPDKELEEGETVIWTPYAYGVFDDADNISINLLKGYKYKFVASMVKDAKNKLSTSTQTIDGVKYLAFLSPFNVSGWISILNKFDYQSSIYMSGLASGNSWVNGKVYDHPNTDRYYGELEDYIPGNKNAKAKIKMKRASFGAKFIAKGKAANSGKLEIQITGAPKMELTPSAEKNHISDTFTFNNVKAAWSTNGNYSETIAVTINWHRADGTTVPLGTHEITYKRNATTVVQVNVINDTSDEGVGYEIDETELGEMPEDDNVTNIEDGKIVETEVETNK